MCLFATLNGTFVNELRKIVILFMQFGTYHFLYWFLFVCLFVCFCYVTYVTQI